MTPTPAVTNTPRPSATPTITKTPTPTVPVEPVIEFFGVIRADDTLVDPVDTGIAGVPIFERPSNGFSLVVEGRPGGSHTDIGANTFNWDPGDPRVLPDLLIEASQALGNGSAAVCDDSAPTFGGVPGIDPPDFSKTQEISNAINDFACRFKDGMGNPSGRVNQDACTLINGLYHFVNEPGTGVQFPSTIQFCGRISGPIAFPPGDTLVTARIRDLAGNVSLPKQLIIRVLATEASGLLGGQGW